jgi:hypothetical protein
MKDYEYMRLWLDLLPTDIIDKYDLCLLADEHGWVYVEIQMGMYGLPQAGILANKLLKQHLNARGYYQCQHTPGLWRHVWCNITFYLVVDDFSVKTTAREHIEHLKTTLEEHYTVAMDWDGSLFCGVNIDWNYPEWTVTLNMPKYIPKALRKFHPTPSLPHHHLTNTSRSNMAHVFRGWTSTHPNHSPKTTSNASKTSSAHSSTTAITARQSKGTVAVANACQQLLNYVATHPNAGICYKACDMILAIHTDASYLSEPGGKSRTSAHFYLTNDEDEEFNNGAILNLS